MPIYEYHCADCRRIVSLLVLRVSDPTPPACPRCGGGRLTRLLSRFVTRRSEEDRLDALADSSALGGLDEGDPASVARWMKKMGSEMGDEVGEDWDDMVDEALDEERSGPSETAEAQSAGDDL